MPAPQNAPLPPFLTLSKDYTVRVTALDPTSGALVAGVVTSNVSLAVDQDDATDNSVAPPVSGAFLPA